MLNFEVERRAVNATEKATLEMGWVFREQFNQDFGIDAHIELVVDGRPDRRLLALQIKGGYSNFYRGKDGLTFYLNEVHKDYWLNYSLPVLLILHDTLNDTLYWREISYSSIEKSTKKWKIFVPYENKFNIEALDKIESYAEFGTTDIDENEVLEVLDCDNDLFVDVKNSEEKGLRLLVSFQSIKQIINLNYFSKNENELADNKWDLDYFNHPYTFLKRNIESHIINNPLDYKDEKNLLIILKNIKTQLSKGGLNNLQCYFFDVANQKTDVPKSSDFLKAIDKFLIEKYGKVISYILHESVSSFMFEIDSKTFEIQTYPGLAIEISDIIERRDFDELVMSTNVSCWQAIYLDAGISKENFVPLFLNKWESYWKNYIKENVFNLDDDQLSEMKEESWRKFQTFVGSYNDIGDIVAFSYNLDIHIIYPLVVHTMIRIFNTEICFEEYCMFQLDSKEWKFIDIEPENDEAICFYVKECEW